MKNDLVNLSRFLSLLLRHKPDTLDLQMDSEGWVSVSELIEKWKRKNSNINFDLLQQIVKENNKNRFTFNEDCTKIRANQGHSISVDLQLDISTPPNILFHGTILENLPSIQEQGLKKQKRNHVHLSSDLETAKKVGIRHGISLVILLIDAWKMHEEGYSFYLSKNQVWLTEEVPPQFIKKMH